MSHILVDICHPAHAHFFRAPIGIWRQQDHTVSITTRDKDVAFEILDSMGLEHISLGTPGKTPFGLGIELIRRNFRLARHMRSADVDIAVGLGGTFAAQSAFLTRIPSVIFYDTEIAKLQNRITYPVATKVVVPHCYSGWTPAAKTIRYNGYHELGYLHPNQFLPDRSIALQAGLDETRPTFLVRIVSWTANHDIGDSGLTRNHIESMVERLSTHGKVIISSEVELPDNLAQFSYRGAASQIHHLMAFCRGYAGESATMASECAVLGVPALYCAHSFRGYTDDQEARYGLVQNIRQLDTLSLQRGLDWLLSQHPETCAAARRSLLNDCIDVAPFVARIVTSTVERRSGPEHTCVGKA